MTVDLAILVAKGVHPLSGRPRRADLDARAVEVALRLTERRPGFALHVIHAGRLQEAALRDYLGMGIDRLTVLELPEGCDPLWPLADHLARLKPAITLAGARSEAEEGSGFLPYALADILGLAIAPAIVELAVDGKEVQLVQALRGGMRRLLSGSLPMMVTVDRAALAPRQSSYGRAVRGRIEMLSVEAPKDSWRPAWHASAARRRGRRLPITSGTSLAERLASLTEAKRGEGQGLIDPSPDEAARAIREFLQLRGLLHYGCEAPRR